MNERYDVAVIGAGIVGLAHAWMAAKRGFRVLVLDRSTAAEGASVRNFGMIWPIGQPAGDAYETALRSRALWLELGSQGVLPLQNCGSIHLAHREDELAVLDEFCQQKTHAARMIPASEIAQRSELANTDRLLGGMYSGDELRVDPRTASASIATWLAQTHKVRVCFDSLITRIDGDRLFASDGRNWQADRIIVCSGSDLQTLYPSVLNDSGLKLCKLQMLSVEQKYGASAPPHIASGLTLRHYASFESCPTHAKLRKRIADETPELDRYGIHVMASPQPDGTVILGDSHQYGDDITPFDSPEIDALIVRELRSVIRLSDWTIRKSWHGIYAKHPELPVFESLTEDGVHVFVGTGGAGMTMSFGLADLAWKHWTGE